MGLLLLTTEKTDGVAHPLMCAKAVEKLTDFFLKQDEQGNGTDTDDTVEECAQQTHLKNLRNEEPKNNKHQDAEEDVQRTRFLHQRLATPDL